MSSGDYVALNKATYDSLVDQYEARMPNDEPGDLMLMAPFFYLLDGRFGKTTQLNLLDIGCGNGLNLRMMTDRGHVATGVDVSTGMAALAKRTAPGARIVAADFLKLEFPSGAFHGIFAKAIIHLFPKVSVTEFLEKVYGALHPKGVFYVTTTVEQFSDEGLMEKRDYVGKPLRYRARWTESELLEGMESAGFQILLQSADREHDRNKTWVNLWTGKSGDRQD
jgi:SAM-dependent methyltransferase